MITANAVSIQIVMLTQNATAVSALMRLAENVLSTQIAVSVAQNAIQANAPTLLTANVLSVLNVQAESAIQENVSEAVNEKFTKDNLFCGDLCRSAFCMFKKGVVCAYYGHCV